MSKHMKRGIAMRILLLRQAMNTFVQAACLVTTEGFIFMVFKFDCFYCNLYHKLENGLSKPAQSCGTCRHLASIRWLYLQNRNPRSHALYQRPSVFHCHSGTHFQSSFQQGREKALQLQYPQNLQVTFSRTHYSIAKMEQI